jgi:hypothetical protein
MSFGKIDLRSNEFSSFSTENQRAPRSGYMLITQKALDLFRKAQGSKSSADVAKSIGISTSKYYHLLSGYITEISVENAKKVNAALGQIFDLSGESNEFPGLSIQNQNRQATPIETNIGQITTAAEESVLDFVQEGPTHTSHRRVETFNDDEGDIYPVLPSDGYFLPSDDYFLPSDDYLEQDRADFFFLPPLASSEAIENTISPSETVGDSHPSEEPILSVDVRSNRKRPRKGEFIFKPFETGTKKKRSRKGEFNMWDPRGKKTKTLEMISASGSQTRPQTLNWQSDDYLEQDRANFPPLPPPVSRKDIENTISPSETVGDSHPSEEPILSVDARSNRKRPRKGEFIFKPFETGTTEKRSRNGNSIMWEFEGEKAKTLEMISATGSQTGPQTLNWKPKWKPYKYHERNKAPVVSKRTPIVRPDRVKKSRTEILDETIFKEGRIPDNFSSALDASVRINPRDRDALGEAIRGCNNLTHETLALLIGDGMTVETVNGCLQGGDIQEIHVRHAKRIEQIFGKKIFNNDEQITSIEIDTRQATTDTQEDHPDPKFDEIVETEAFDEEFDFLQLEDY